MSYQALPTIYLKPETAYLYHNDHPELVHLDHPAYSVMTDIRELMTHVISPKESMDDALNEMKLRSIHEMLVVNNDGHIEGMLAIEDLLGTKPAKVQSARNIKRGQVTVKHLMTPLSDIVSMEHDVAKYAKVGNIVETMRANHTHYIVVVNVNEDDETQTIRGIFVSYQVSRQLHTNIASLVNN